jgi:predicted dithiol-disulfide oxidoreductase (DUF899 family)
MARTKTLFPGETTKYRAARNRLLKEEVKLRREIEKVAAKRRKLPLGGPPPEDYVFDSANGTLKLSELFESGKDTLLVYNFMFGPQMAEPCPYCSSILDSVDGAAPHVSDRVNLAIVAKSPIERVLAFARERGWRHLRLLSSASNTYNRDYQGETESGDQLPMMNVFTRRRGRVYHLWATEMFFAPPDRGQDPRHVDLIWPVWNLLDMTPEGRSAKWGPKLRY